MTGIQHMVRDIMYSQENGAELGSVSEANYHEWQKSSPGMPWLINVTDRVFATTLVSQTTDCFMNVTGQGVTQL